VIVRSCRVASFLCRVRCSNSVPVRGQVVVNNEGIASNRATKIQVLNIDVAVMFYVFGGNVVQTTCALSEKECQALSRPERVRRHYLNRRDTRGAVKVSDQCVSHQRGNDSVRFSHSGRLLLDA